MKKLVLVVVLLVLFASPILAGWEYTFLEPAGIDSFYGSSANAISNGQIVGYVRNSGIPHAALRSVNDKSYRDIHPTGASMSIARDISGGKIVGQIGNLIYPYRYSSHAYLWDTNTNSNVDLNPNEYSYSVAYSIFNDQIVGVAKNSPLGNSDTFINDGIVDYTYGNAALWNASNGDFVSLHNQNASRSYAFAIDNGKIVGQIGTSATSWNSSSLMASSFGSSDSIAFGIYQEQIVGAANSHSKMHAALWNSSSDGYVDLHPDTPQESIAYGVSDGYQVGYVGLRAAIWNGSAESYFDLGSILPNSNEQVHLNIGVDANSVTDYYLGGNYSIAYDIEVIHDDIWVVGQANNKAVLWHYNPSIPDTMSSVPEPSSLLVVLAFAPSCLAFVRRKK